MILGKETRNLFKDLFKCISLLNDRVIEVDTFTNDIDENIILLERRVKRNEGLIEAMMKHFGLKVVYNKEGYEIIKKEPTK